MVSQSRSAKEFGRASFSKEGRATEEVNGTGKLKTILQLPYIETEHVISTGRFQYGLSQLELRHNYFLSFFFVIS